MHSEDALRSDEVVDFFQECLYEQGLESAQVAHQTSPESFLDEFYVQMPKGNSEKLVYKTTIDLQTRANSADAVRKIVALEAEEVAEEFSHKLVTSFEYDGRRVEVSPYNGGWARCCQCDTKADAPKAQYLITDGCELSDPNPVHRDMTREWENMDDHEQVLFKMYLLGRLREQCDTDCPNYKYNRKI